MTTVNWLVDTKIFNNEEEVAAFSKAVYNANDSTNLFFTKYVPFSSEPSFNISGFNGPTVVYGTISFVKSVLERKRKHDSLVAGYSIPATPVYAYGFTPDIDCLQYRPRLPSEWFINEQYVVVPFVEFVEKRNWWYDVFKTDTVFIRPNSGTKVFTGTVIPKKDFDYEINCLKQLSGVVDSTLVLVSPGVQIKDESRLVVANGQIIHSVKYIENGHNYYDRLFNQQVSEDVMSLGHKVATWPWQVDHCYVVDIATLSDGRVGIVEFNSFCSAGMYTLNFKQIVDQINDITRKVASGSLILER